MTIQKVITWRLRRHGWYVLTKLYDMTNAFWSIDHGDVALEKKWSSSSKTSPASRTTSGMSDKHITPKSNLFRHLKTSRRVCQT